MKIKGSKGYYDVNLDELSCTCKDWTCRRHVFPKGSDKRLCKHLIEALELRDSFDGGYSTSSARIIGESDIKRLSDKLKSSNIVLRFMIGWRKFTPVNQLPVVISRTYNQIPCVFIDNMFTELGFILNESHSTECIRYYDGYVVPIKVVLTDNNEYLFKSIYSRLDSEGVIKLSSVSIRKLGLKLTDKGFINKSNELEDKDVATDEELCDLLGITSIRCI